nr:hypothetical protein [Bradyrhizobium lablabi]
MQRYARCSHQRKSAALVVKFAERFRIDVGRHCPQDPLGRQYNVGDRLADVFTHLRIEHRISILVVRDEAQLDQHGRSLELQDGKIGPLLDFAVLQVHDLEQSVLHLLRQLFVLGRAIEHLEAVGVVAVGVIDVDRNKAFATGILAFLARSPTGAWSVPSSRVMNTSFPRARSTSFNVSPYLSTISDSRNRKPFSVWVQPLSNTPGLRLLMP